METKGLPYIFQQIKAAEEKIDKLNEVLDALLGEREMVSLPPPAVSVLALSPTEMKVLKLIGQDKTNAEIATALRISKRTVEAHRYNMQKKLGVDSAALKTMAKTNGVKNFRAV